MYHQNKLILSKLSIILLIAMTCLNGLSCGGASTKSSSNNSGTTSASSSSVPTDYNSVIKTSENQIKNLSTTNKDVTESLNTLLEFDPDTASGDDITKPFDDFLVKLQLLVDNLEYYQDLMDAYNTHLSNSSSSSNLVTPQIQYQSVDPLLLLDIKDWMKAGLNEKEIIDKLKAQGASDEDIAAAVKKATDKVGKSGIKFGLTAVFGGGAGAFGGLLAGSLGAPVLVSVGVGAAVGLTAGAFFSYCTSGSSSNKKLKYQTATSGDYCAIATVDTKVVTLPDGSKGLIFSLPQGGPGKMCVHLEGSAPICFSTKVDADGNKYTLACLADDDDSAEESNKCQKVTDTPLDVVGTNCSDHVKSISANAVVSGGAKVTVNTNLPTTGCSISYSVKGTDGYTQSGSPKTNSSGQISFSIPGGADGVSDTVILTETSSGSSTTIGYTF
ncbi:hypothetical protein BVY03_02605 [bacterium K02(2017)]|nr:hypothetical protein BVY03_02605 [bacterium K02(2017)]